MSTRRFVVKVTLRVCQSILVIRYVWYKEGMNGPKSIVSEYDRCKNAQQFGKLNDTPASYLHMDTLEDHHHWTR